MFHHNYKEKARTLEKLCMPRVSPEELGLWYDTQAKTNIILDMQEVSGGV